MKKYNFAKKVSKMLIKWLKVVRPSDGTTLPGAFMLKLCPDFIWRQKDRIKKDIIFITGTNGKTTSTGLLSSIFEANNLKIIDNKNGANMPQGIATCFLQNDDKETDYCIFESDEAWLYSMAESLNINYLLVTNLFSDQVERFGGVYNVVKKIKSAIDLRPEMTLFLNADDPHLLPLQNDNTIYYGIEKVENNTKDMNKYPEMCTCGSKFTYKKRFYAHLGEFHCLNCKNKHHVPDYSAKVILNDDGVELIINRKKTFTSSLPGLYNAYNLLGVISMALHFGIEDEVIQTGLDNYKNMFGRTNIFEENGKNIFVQLIKNPVGVNQCMKLIKKDIDSKLFILMNDNFADGRDISWIYDADFEYFNDYQNKIVLSGSRAKEIALRLKHAGLREEKMYISENINNAYEYALKNTSRDGCLYVLGNYSALKDLKKIMKR